jgi:hypothetical protein
MRKSYRTSQQKTQNVKTHNRIKQKTKKISNNDFNCCVWRLYFQLFVGKVMSYLRYLCLFAHSGVQHILCCVLFCLWIIRLFNLFTVIVPDEGSSRKRDVCTLDISFIGVPVNIHQAATSCRQTLFCKALSYTPLNSIILELFKYNINVYILKMLWPFNEVKWCNLIF